MAGLLAARVLADHYDRVIVVDRDPLPTHVPVPARGAARAAPARPAPARAGRSSTSCSRASPTSCWPPARCPPTCWTRAVSCSPGTGSGRRRAGCAACCAAARSWRGTCGPGSARCRRCASLQAAITGLTSSADRSQITGVRIAPSRCPERTIDTDLVVDATGRGSRTPLWLAELGYQRPAEDRVEIGMGYATRTFRLRPDALGGDALVINGGTPDHPRSGVLAALEGGRHIVTPVRHPRRPPADRPGRLRPRSPTAWPSRTSPTRWSARRRWTRG